MGPQRTGKAICSPTAREPTDFKVSVDPFCRPLEYLKNLPDFTQTVIPKEFFLKKQVVLLLYIKSLSLWKLVSNKAPFNTIKVLSFAFASIVS